jgi:hypothetical protein
LESSQREDSQKEKMVVWRRLGDAKDGMTDLTPRPRPELPGCTASAVNMEGNGMMGSDEGGLWPRPAGDAEEKKTAVEEIGEMKAPPSRTYLWVHVITAEAGEVHKILVHGTFPVRGRGVLDIGQTGQPVLIHRHRGRHKRRSSP